MAVKAKSKKTQKDGQRWVWMLTDEDITEMESSMTLWYDKKKARAAMEESIRELCTLYEDSKLERSDADHAYLEGRNSWSIRKVKVNY